MEGPGVLLEVPPQNTDLGFPKRRGEEGGFDFTGASGEPGAPGWFQLGTI